MFIILLSEYAKVPTKSNSGDAGFDLYSPIDTVVKAGESKLIKLDISITNFPPETYGRIAPRSSLGLKGVQILGGVVDPTYQGNIGVILSVKDDLIINRGDRIAQLIFERYCSDITFNIADQFNIQTERGVGGFGSTGI